MQDRYLFRAETLTGGWIEGFYCRKREVGKWKHYIIPDGMAILEVVEINPDTLAQYTGLHDKNGKLIFEGDILEYRFGYAERDVMFAQIQWSSHMFIAMNDTLHRGTWLPTWIEDSIVIGNIHDNQELLNGGI